MISDEQIIKLVLSGKKEHYKELMQRHQQTVARLAYRILTRKDDAEDVVQETFVRAYEKLAECRDGSKFGPWVRKIALNVCLKMLPVELPVEEVWETNDRHDNPVEQVVLGRIEAQRLWKAVSDLPTAYRTIIVLRYEEEMELKEIAELLNESIGTIYTRLHRARKLLTQRLEVTANGVL